MKKIIFFLLFILASLCSIAQDTYRAVSLTYGVWDAYKESYKWDDLVPVDVPVTVKGTVINVYSQRVQTFRTLDEGRDLDAYTIQWYAIDQDGDHCHIRFTSLDDNFFMAISYSNICYYYKLEEY
jgi:hypothetical protein